jgi:hypothetical protein
VSVEACEHQPAEQDRAECAATIAVTVTATVGRFLGTLHRIQRTNGCRRLIPPRGKIEYGLRILQPDLAGAAVAAVVAATLIMVECSWSK